MKKKLSLPL